MRKLKHHHVFWPRIISIPSLLILPSSPPLPLCLLEITLPLLEITLPPERGQRRVGLYCNITLFLGAWEKVQGPAQQPMAHCPTRRAFLIKFTRSTIITLRKHQPSQNTILFRALTTLTFHLRRRSWSSFRVFGLPIISLPLLFSLKANWYLLKDDLIVVFTSRLIYCKY